MFTLKEKLRKLPPKVLNLIECISQAERKMIQIETGTAKRKDEYWKGS
jgi:hypothetical protein